MLKSVIAALSAIALAGCGSSKISSVPTSTAAHPVRVIAMAPGGGILSDAVGVELANRRYTVVEAAATTTLLARLGINEVEIARPEGLAKLEDQGIDAMLSVRAAAGGDMVIAGASARMTSTRSGQLLAGVSWQNSWAGQQGSIADRQWRKGMVEAATEIADALAARIGAPQAGTPYVRPAAVPAPPVAVSPTVPPPAERSTGGQDSRQVERLGDVLACNAHPRAILTAKGPGFETYRVACTGGDTLIARCELGNCRVLK